MSTNTHRDQSCALDHGESNGSGPGIYLNLEIGNFQQILFFGYYQWSYENIIKGRQPKTRLLTHGSSIFFRLITMLALKPGSLMSISLALRFFVFP